WPSAGRARGCSGTNDGKRIVTVKLRSVNGFLGPPARRTRSRCGSFVNARRTSHCHHGPAADLADDGRVVVLAVAGAGCCPFAQQAGCLFLGGGQAESPRGGWPSLHRLQMIRVVVVQSWPAYPACSNVSVSAWASVSPTTATWTSRVGI